VDDCGRVHSGGLAVGADIPASWSLIAKWRPKAQEASTAARRRCSGTLGPVVVLLMFLVMAPLGILGARIVFAHLAVVGLLLTFLRSRMKESEVWVKAKASRTSVRSHWQELFTRGI